MRISQRAWTQYINALRKINDRAYKAMKDYLDHVGATINRSVYGSAQDAGLITLQLRERLKKLFHFPEPVTHVILSPGATWGLNMAIKGFLKPGDFSTFKYITVEARSFFRSRFFQVKRGRGGVGVRSRFRIGNKSGFKEPVVLY